METQKTWEGDTLKTPKVDIGKYITPFRAILAVAVISVGFIAWQFGLKPVWQGQYDKGYKAGEESGVNAVWNNLSAQLVQTGKLQLPAKNENGEQGFIIFIPQAQ